MLKHLQHQNTKIDCLLTSVTRFIDDTSKYLPVITDYLKLLSSNGCLLIVCSSSQLLLLSKELQSNNIIIKDLIVWNHHNSNLNKDNLHYKNNAEFVVWGVKSDNDYVFNQLGDTPSSSTFEIPFTNDELNSYKSFLSLKLIKQLVLIHTNSNQLVLDPFMGSGTTGVACIASSRQYKGIETDAFKFDISFERIQKEKENLPNIFAHI
jgi:DNA modification methylase